MALPEFGFMTKADKQKLDSVPSDTLITATTAANVFLAKTDSATFLTRADLISLIENAKGD